MAANPIPPALNKRALSNTKTPASQEMEHTPANQNTSPPKKKKLLSKPSTLDSADVFEAATAVAGASREVSVVFSKFAEVVSERAAADTSQMKELEGILMEARNLESYLKEKKKHLRETLTQISDKLQG